MNRQNPLESLNHGFAYRDEIGGEYAGASALDYLTSRYEHSTREEWAGRFVDGQILVDGATATADTALRAGHALVWHRPPWIEPYAPLAFAVLYEDDHLVAVLKPPGLPTLPGGGFLEHTLLYRLRRRVPHAGLLHRLGRWTSGIVLAAKSSTAHAAVSAAFRERRVGKRYRALAAGRPCAATFAIETPIGTVPHPILGAIHAASADGRRSRSRVAVVEQRDGAFLADVWIETGRPHQIRIHLAAAGHPLVGDPIYAAGGRPAPDCRALPGDPGYLLHATEMRLAHPITGAPLVIEAPPPRALSMHATGRLEGDAPRSGAAP
jgi:23S rRNA pseudouridine1911/1915/1917 synthase